MSGARTPYPPDWLVPDWPAPGHVRSVFTTRVGGVSQPPFDALNLGDHVHDAPADVRANRALLGDALAARPVFMQQVHGSEVARLSPAIAGAGEPPTAADACLTTHRAVACTVMVADCLPVLLTDRQGTAVAAAHAGWRGLAGVAGRGVLEAAHAALIAAATVDAGPPEIMAWLGPCIGPLAFEVGDEVRAAFMASDPAAIALFRAHAPGKWLADLPGLARRRLQAMGVASVHGNDGSAPWCTVGNPSRFFSYRRERVTGRMAACVWLA